MRRSIYALLTIHLITGLASAQESAVAAFRLIGIETSSIQDTTSMPIQKEYFYFDGNEIASLNFPQNRISGRHDYVGEFPIVIYSERPSYDGIDVTGGEVAFEIPAVGGSNNLLVLGFGLNREFPKFLPVDARFPNDGSQFIKLLNISPNKTAIRLGSKRLYLERGEIVSVKKDNLDFSNGLLQVAVEESGNGRWEVVYSKYTPVSADGSFFVLVFKEHLSSGKWKTLALKNERLEEPEAETQELPDEPDDSKMIEPITPMIDDGINDLNPARL